MTTKYKQFGSTITSTEGESDEDFDTNTDFDLLFGSSAHNDVCIFPVSFLSTVAWPKIIYRVPSDVTESYCLNSSEGVVLH